MRSNTRKEEKMIVILGTLLIAAIPVAMIVWFFEKFGKTLNTRY